MTELGRLFGLFALPRTLREVLPAATVREEGESEGALSLFKAADR